MASSYLNIVTFLFTTLFYYLALKPNLTYDTLKNPTEYKNYITNNYIYLGVYVLLVIVIQFMVNASIISSTCGGNITENMGSAGIFTFLPWLFIFGVLVLVLTMYPGFKSAFADVVGYYYVYNSANKVITELLLDKDIQKQMDSDPTITNEQKDAMQEAADAIIKICGNNSILINQIVPSNFNDYLAILKPLMKPKYQTDGNNSVINELFDLVVTRDNVGEAMWFIYTGLLLTSIVQLKITTGGCSSSPQTMEQNYQQFLEKEQSAKASQEKATDTTYTITS
jgi:hypothetical protein